MSNVSGIGQNKTYRGSVPRKEPYYYIRASLDLAGKKANNVISWFNQENNYNYLSTEPNIYHPNPADYDKYYKIDNNSLVGEVNVYSSNDLVFSESNLTNDFSNELASDAQLVSVARASGTASLTLSVSAFEDLNLRVGDHIQVSGVTNDADSFNTGAFVPITAISGTNGEVIEYTNAGSDFGPAAATGTSKLLEGQITLQVGGAYLPSSPDLTTALGLDLWGGPTGNVPGNIIVSELQDGQICYYGSEPNDLFLLGQRPYLAMRLGGGNSSNSIVSGKIHVVVKVYVKY